MHHESPVGFPIVSCNRTVTELYIWGALRTRHDADTLIERLCLAECHEGTVEKGLIEGYECGKQWSQPGVSAKLLFPLRPLLTHLPRQPQARLIFNVIVVFIPLAASASESEPCYEGMYNIQNALGALASLLGTVSLVLHRESRADSPHYVLPLLSRN